MEKFDVSKSLVDEAKSINLWCEVQSSPVR